MEAGAASAGWMCDDPTMPVRTDQATQRSPGGSVLLHPIPELGDTLLVDGRPAVVVALLPGRQRGETRARYAHDMTCSRCGAVLGYCATLQWWRCGGCGRIYGRYALTRMVRARG